MADHAGRIQVIRWRAIAPLVLVLALIALAYVLFADRIAQSASEEAATKALGTQVEMDALRIRAAQGTVELHGLRVADPFDRMRNLVEANRIVVALEPLPLLERKIVVRQLTLGDLRFGTARRTPARAVSGDGFAPRTLRELERWSAQFRRPILSLTPIDTIKAIALDPSQLATVRQALALGTRADSVKHALEQGFRGLALEQTLDSARALAARLAGARPAALGLDGTRRAVADVRRTLDDLRAAQARVQILEQSARSGAALLASGVGGIDDARRHDYAFARGLLKLPSFEGPDIGEALFGPVTIERFQQAVYWAELAQRYLPPGLRPRQNPGPERLRLAGTTVRFPKQNEYPSFLLRAADVSFTVVGGNGAGAYTLALRDVTTAPALLGRPARFAARSTGGGAIGSVRLAGFLDHVSVRPRDSVGVAATGVRLPAFELPGLPWRAVPGAGTSQLDFALRGDQVQARWSVRSEAVAFLRDSGAAGADAPLQQLVGRVLAGLHHLDLTAELEGDIRAPTLSIRSNLDRAIGARLREVAGEEVARAEARARAAVDSIVSEKSAPVKAKVADVRATAERRVADARAQLAEQRSALEARLKALTGGLGGLLPTPGR